MLSYILTMTRIGAILSDNRIVPVNKKHIHKKHVNKFVNKVVPKNYHNKGFRRKNNKDMSHRQRQ